LLRSLTLHNLHLEGIGRKYMDLEILDLDILGQQAGALPAGLWLDDTLTRLRLSVGDLYTRDL
jgi:hypothetical protein